MSLIKCPECVQNVSEKAHSCPHCGFPISEKLVPALPDSVECLDCKETFSFNDEVCPHCGLFNSQKYEIIQPVENQEQPKTQTIVITPPKSKSIAVLLAIVLGGLGLHKFYLNRPGWGVIYLLFFWTFIPGIIGIIEGLGYLFMSEQTFQEEYGALVHSAGITGSHTKRIKKCSNCGAKNRLEDFTCISCGKSFL